MYKTLFTTMLLTAGNLLAAQNFRAILSGNYGLIDHHYEDTNAASNAPGITLGFEYVTKSGISIGLDIDWQKLEPIDAIALPILDPSKPLLPYSINRHQFNIRPTVRYHFKEDFKGLNVGIFASRVYQTITAKDYPQDSDYLPDLYNDPADYTPLGGGVTYGYMFNINTVLRASLQGSHQIAKESGVKGAQFDHQWGAGLSFVF